MHYTARYPPVRADGWPEKRGGQANLLRARLLTPAPQRQIHEGPRANKAHTTHQSLHSAASMLSTCLACQYNGICAVARHHCRLHHKRTKQPNYRNISASHLHCRQGKVVTRPQLTVCKGVGRGSAACNYALASSIMAISDASTSSAMDAASGSSNIFNIRVGLRVDRIVFPSCSYAEIRHGSMEATSIDAFKTRLACSGLHTSRTWKGGRVGFPVSQLPNRHRQSRGRLSVYGCFGYHKDPLETYKTKPATPTQTQRGRPPHLAFTLKGNALADHLVPQVVFPHHAELVGSDGSWQPRPHSGERRR